MRSSRNSSSNRQSPAQEAGAAAADARTQAVTDALTGLPNRRCLRDYLRRGSARAKRYGGTVAAIMLDIDHFQKINDDFGHEAGHFAWMPVCFAISAWRGMSFARNPANASGERDELPVEHARLAHGIGGLGMPREDIRAGSLDTSAREAGELVVLH